MAAFVGYHPYMENARIFRNWHFELNEVSASVYKVKAVHALGPMIEMTGTDEIKLLAEARAAAVKMELEIERKVSRGKS